MEYGTVSCPFLNIYNYHNVTNFVTAVTYRYKALESVTKRCIAFSISIKSVISVIYRFKTILIALKRLPKHFYFNDISIKS